MLEHFVKMDTADADEPDVPSLQSSFQATRPERYQLDDQPPTSPKPSSSNLSQVFDFGSILRTHPRKYKILLQQDLEEDGTVEAGKQNLQKTGALTPARRKSRARSLDGSELSERQIISQRQKAVRDAFLKKKSVSHADVLPYSVSQSGSRDEDEKSSYLQDLKNELIFGSDETAHMCDSITDSEDEGPVSSSSTISQQSQISHHSHGIFRRHSFEVLDEQPELATVNLSDGSTVKLPDVEALTISGQSTPASEETSPMGSPRLSPRTRPKHEALAENTDCVPVSIQSDKKRLFGIGPEYQPPPEQVYMKRDDAKQLGLLQRVVKEGFTAAASKKTFFHQKEDMDFFPPEKPPTVSAVDGAKTAKSRFISKAEMNFLSPSSM